MLGALLLIIVVIAAVASLSVFLSQAQSNAENRSAYIAAVQNEDLQVTYAQFSPNNPGMQWQLDQYAGTAPYSNYYIQILGPSTIELTQKDSMNPPVTAALSGGNSLMIRNGESASLVPSGTTPPYTLTFGAASCAGAINSPDCWQFSPAIWSNVTISVRNLNTVQSELYQVQVNSNWLSGWEEVTQTGQALPAPVLGGPNDPSIIIPARGTLNFNLSLASDGITVTKNESMKITLLTKAGNYFTTSYVPPTAVVTSNTASENYQVVTRDIVTLDGSDSAATDTSIQSYSWQLVLPQNSAGCTTAAFGNPSHLDVAYTSGETIQYLPESIFTASQLSADCVAGPIQATLTVTDDNGLSYTSAPLLISADPNIAPVASLSVVCSDTGASPGYVTIQADNIFGTPVNGVVVTAITTIGNAVVGAPGPAGTTGTSATCAGTPTGDPGQITFPVTWTSGSSVEFDTGALPPVTVTFS